MMSVQQIALATIAHTSISLFVIAIYFSMLFQSVPTPTVEDSALDSAQNCYWVSMSGRFSKAILITHPRPSWAVAGSYYDFETPPPFWRPGFVIEAPIPNGNNDPLNVAIEYGSSCKITKGMWIPVAECIVFPLASLGTLRSFRQGAVIQTLNGDIAAMTSDGLSFQGNHKHYSIRWLALCVDTLPMLLLGNIVAAFPIRVVSVKLRTLEERQVARSPK